MDDAALERAADAALATIDARGPLPWSDVLAALGDAGTDLTADGEEDALRWHLVEERGVVVVGEPAIAATDEQVHGGRVVTHRVGEREVAHGYVLEDADLSLLLGGIGGLDLPGEGGTALRRRFGPDRELGLDRHEQAVVGPEGWLDGVAPGELVAVRLEDGEIAVAPAGEPAPDGDLPDRLAAALPGSADRDGLSYAGWLVADVCARDPEAFRVPHRPLTELLADAGLVVEDMYVGPPGFDFEAFWERKRAEHAASLAEGGDLDELDALLLADLQTKAVLFEGDGELDPEEWEQVRVAFASPEATRQFCDSPIGALGLFGDTGSVDRLRRFAEATIAADPDHPPAGAHVALARCAADAGDLLAAEAHTTAALGVDPDFEPALADTAFFAAVRCQPVRAAAALRRSGLPADGLLDILEVFAGTGDVAAGRNDPCPCGSGDKHKRCCGRYGGHSLRRRALLLWRTAAWFADRPAGRRQRLPLALAAAGVDDPDEAPELVFAGLFGEDLVELQLFEGGGIEAFVDAALPLLPADEAALVQRWRGCRHRVWELVERPGDGRPWTVRDAETGEERVVEDLPGITGWDAGQRFLAAAVPVDAGGTVALLGAVRSLTGAQVDELLAAGGGDGSVGGRAALLASVVIGPTLEASAAARGAVADLDARFAFVFPGARVGIDDLEADPQLLDELLWDYDYLADPEEAADAEEAAAMSFSDSLFRMTIGQLLGDEPPEVWATAQRLSALGRDHVEVLQMLCSTMVGQLHAMVYDDAPYDPDRHRADLDALPGSFDERRRQEGW